MTMTIQTDHRLLAKEIMHVYINELLESGQIDEWPGESFYNEHEEAAWLRIKANGWWTDSATFEEDNLYVERENRVRQHGAYIGNDLYVGDRLRSITGRTGIEVVIDLDAVRGHWTEHWDANQWSHDPNIPVRIIDDGGHDLTGVQFMSRNGWQFIERATQR